MERMVMGGLQEFGIAFILWIQAFRSPALDAAFDFFTQFGGAGYILLIPLVVWCFDSRLGLRAALAMLVAQLLVMILKDVFQEQRPFVVDSRVWSDGEFGLSFPSGHALGAIVYYGLLAERVQRRGFTIAMAVTIFLIGLSRSYLGVHYPHDVIAGWGLGALLLWAWLACEAPFAAAVRVLSGPTRTLLLCAIPLSIALLHNLVWNNVSTFAIAGGISGAALALAAWDEGGWGGGWGGEKSGWSLRLLRLLLGVPGVLVLVVVMSKIFPLGSGAFGRLLVWSSGLVMLLFIGLGAPRLFVRLRLASLGPANREGRG